MNDNKQILRDSPPKDIGCDDADDVPTSSVHYVYCLLDQLKKNGLPTSEYLREARINLDELKEQTRIDSQKLSDLITAVSLALQDETLGYASDPVKPGSFYMMGRMAVHELVLGKALLIGLTFYERLIDGYALSLQTNNNLSTLTLELKVPDLDHNHILTEIVLISWHRYCSWLIGQNITVVEATYAYPAPKHVDEYRHIFSTKHSFNAKTTSISFDSHYLEKKIIQSGESFEAFIRTCPLNMLLQYSGSPCLSSIVKKYLSHNLNAGVPSIEQVAEALHLTSQTLRRHLKHEGTSFQQLKDMTRCDLAMHYLSTTDAPIAEVAELVGFSEHSVFVRAFKGWTGASPSEYRKTIS